MKLLSRGILLYITICVCCACQSTNTIAMQEIQVNDKISIANTMKLQLKEYEIVFDFIPDKPSGYYRYFEKKEDYAYVKIEFTIQNDSDYTLELQNVYATLIANDKDYEGTMILEKDDKSDFVKELEKDKSDTGYIVFQIPSTLKREEVERLQLHFNDVLQISELDLATYHYDINLK